MKRKHTIIMISAVIILSVSMAVGVIAYERTRPTTECTLSEDAMQQACLTLNKQRHDLGQVGEINVGGMACVILEDKEYEYKISENGDIVSLLSTNADSLMKFNEELADMDSLETLAYKYLEQYSGGDPNPLYKMTESEYEEHGTAGSCYTFCYEEITSNDIKTGNSFMISVDHNGKLISLARHFGDVQVATDTTVGVNEDQAHKIAMDYICESEELLAPQEPVDWKISELNVRSDNLVWELVTAPYYVDGNELGVELWIDAETGEVLHADSYCSISEIS